MQHFDCILFDLDGTLTDPADGITNSVAHALEKYGITVPDKARLNCFIGPPLTESFEKHYDFTHGTAVEAVEYYREYFSDRGIFENLIYPGVPELLKRLNASGKIVLLATSKPQVFAVRILEHFGIDRYFTAIAGSELDGSRVKKADVIEHALTLAGITDRSHAVMVGDREHDILGAKRTRISSVGVLYGYGSREELRAADAEHIAGSVLELERVLLS